MCIDNDNYSVKLYYCCCCCSGSHENGLKPVLARQSKYSVGQANGQTTPQPERFVSPSPQPSSPQIPSPLAPLVPSSPLLQRQQLDATLPLLVSSPHSQPLQGELWCQQTPQMAYTSLVLHLKKHIRGLLSAISITKVQLFKVLKQINLLKLNFTFNWKHESYYKSIIFVKN